MPHPGKDIRQQPGHHHEYRLAYQSQYHTLGDNPRALFQLTGTQVLGDQRVGIGHDAEEQCDADEEGHSATQCRGYMRGINPRHEEAVGENHQRIRTL